MSVRALPNEFAELCSISATLRETLAEGPACQTRGSLTILSFVLILRVICSGGENLVSFQVEKVKRAHRCEHCRLVKRQGVWEKRDFETTWHTNVHRAGANELSGNSFEMGGFGTKQAFKAHFVTKCVRPRLSK